MFFRELFWNFEITTWAIAEGQTTGQICKIASFWWRNFYDIRREPKTRMPTVKIGDQIGPKEIMGAEPVLQPPIFNQSSKMTKNPKGRWLNMSVADNGFIADDDKLP